MATATLGTTPDLQPGYNYKLEIDTTPTATAPTWATVCAGIENIEEALNETSDTFYFMCGKGFGDSEVTGLSPEVKLTGKRAIGDAAQDYVFGFAQKYGIYSPRHTHLRITQTLGTAAAATTAIVSANATIKDVQEIKADMNKPSDISFTLAINGAPVSGDAWAA